jgi:AcrR family transcriptional regulator
MSTVRTARERARAEIHAEILATARRQLAEVGASALSLRAVARELGVVPSAVYRYFDGRDALITALITEAYDALGDTVDRAADASARRRPRGRWTTMAQAVRTWAHAHPHEYALLYGTPVPGYAAPVDTVAPGTRVPRRLLAVVAEAHAAGDVEARPTSLSAASRRELAALLVTVELDLPVDVLFRTILGWTQLFGLVTFELFNQTRGMFGDDAAVFDDASTAIADMIGLR